MRMRARAVAVLILSTATSAHADDIARADRLFEEGVKLLATDAVTACKKFDEAYGLNPNSTGVLLRRAECAEKRGDIATALELYDRAAKVAREASVSCKSCARDQEAEAQHRIALLVGDVPHVTIVLAEKPDGTKVVVAGKLQGDKLADLPVDPGVVPIVVSAPGRVTFETRVEIKKRETIQVDIPRLAASADTSRGGVGKVMVAAGAATVIAGSVMGYLAKRRYDAVFDDGACNRDTLACTTDGDQRVKAARTLGTAGTIVGAVGLVAAGAGVYLWLTSPKAQSAEARVSLLPHLGTDDIGVVAVGRF